MIRTPSACAYSIAAIASLRSPEEPLMNFSGTMVTPGAIPAIGEPSAWEAAMMLAR